MTYTVEKPFKDYDSSKVFKNIGGVVTYTVEKAVKDYISSKVSKDIKKVVTYTELSKDIAGGFSAIAEDVSS